MMLAIIVMDKDRWSDDLCGWTCLPLSAFFDGAAHDIDALPLNDVGTVSLQISVVYLMRTLVAPVMQPQVVRFAPPPRHSCRCSALHFVSSL